MSSVTTQRLAEIPLFSNMDDEERRELRALMTERIFQPGQVVMKAGEEGSSFQIIERGEVEIWLIDTDGKKVVLDVLGPGLFFQAEDGIRDVAVTGVQTCALPI